MKINPVLKNDVSDEKILGLKQNNFEVTPGTICEVIFGKHFLEGKFESIPELKGCRLFHPPNPSARMCDYMLRRIKNHVTTFFPLEIKSVHTSFQETEYQVKMDENAGKAMIDKKLPENGLICVINLDDAYNRDEINWVAVATMRNEINKIEDPSLPTRDTFEITATTYFIEKEE